MIYTSLGKLYCLTTSIIMHAYILELGETSVNSVASDPFSEIVGLVERSEAGLISIWWRSLVQVRDRRPWKKLVIYL